jgi:hypothetical protein
MSAGLRSVRSVLAAARRGVGLAACRPGPGGVLGRVRVDEASLASKIEHRGEHRRTTADVLGALVVLTVGRTVSTVVGASSMRPASRASVPPLGRRYSWSSLFRLARATSTFTGAEDGTRRRRPVTGSLTISTSTRQMPSRTAKTPSLPRLRDRLVAPAGGFYARLSTSELFARCSPRR